MALKPRRHPLNLIRVMPAKGRTLWQNSKLIAGLVGPLLAALGIAMPANHNLIPAKGRTLWQNSKLIAGLVGPLLATLGIAMLANHNVIPAINGEFAHNDALVFLRGLLAIGAFLSFKAYGHQT